MTKELRKSIMTRNRLHKKFLESKSSEDWEKYHMQRNYAVSIRRRCIKNYFKNKAHEGARNPRVFWSTFKPFLRSKQSCMSTDIHLIENNSTITDKKNHSTLNHSTLLQPVRELIHSSP
jgi:hypothetical protein